MLYFSTHSKARAFAAMFQRCSVLDMKGKPSINGKRWAKQCRRDDPKSVYRVETVN